MKIPSSKIALLIILLLFQSCCSMLLITVKYMKSFEQSISIFNFPYTIETIMNIIGISSIIWVLYIAKTYKNEEEYEQKINSSMEIIEALRGQKHDFNNHLNVIGGMIQLNKCERALEYIHKISGKTNEVFSISKIENVEIAAVLYSKCAIAESKGIEVELDIESSLDDLKIDSVEVSKVLFNLIDNAIYELENSKEEDKILTIEISEDHDSYIFAIGNSYPILANDLYDKIFERGFTTKGDNGHGYGLHIVKGIVEKNKGRITVESYEGVGTIFTVFLPKKSTYYEVVITGEV